MLKKIILVSLLLASSGYALDKQELLDTLATIPSVQYVGKPILRNATSLGLDTLKWYEVSVLHAADSITLRRQKFGFWVADEGTAQEKAHFDGRNPIKSPQGTSQFQDSVQVLIDPFNGYVDFIDEVNELALVWTLQTHPTEAGKFAKRDGVVFRNAGGTLVLREIAP